MAVHELAGKPAPEGLLVNIPRLVSLYYTGRPDPANPAQQVAFGTSGHRGTSLRNSFNEAHILATAQAICDYRNQEKISGPLFLGMDTHALSEPSHMTTLEVLAANGVRVMVHQGMGYTPTPVISHAILTHNRHNPDRPADGIVITPSHNPPEDGGFKYNPPHGGPADTGVTAWIEKRANALMADGNRDVRRIPYEKALRAETTVQWDFITPYVHDLENILHMDAIRDVGHPDRRGPHGRRGGGVLGADRRAVRAGSQTGQHDGRPDLPVHAPRPGRQNPDGLLVAIRHGPAHRNEGGLRHRLRQRSGCGPARHRHPERRAHEPQSLSCRRHLTIFSGTGPAGGPMRPSARPWSAAP